LMSRIRSSQNATTELKFLALLRSARIKGWRRNYPLTGKPDFTFPKAKLTVGLPRKNGQ
jgi:DNA mismatch endonuclease (patch repair protein)